jgi:hypothetical protein
MRPNAAVPPTLRAALRPTHPRCYRHCEKPLRGRPVTIAAPGSLVVYACPGGAVSVVTYTEWGNADPTPKFRRFLDAHTAPPTLVRRWDLRLASRHGPELGAKAERYLARARPARPLRTVYWRLYPFKKKDGTVFRPFACFRHGEGGVRFFVAPGDQVSPKCPRCPAPKMP